MVAGTFLAQHDHTFSFATTTGSDWVRLVVVAGAILLTAAALLRPFVTAIGRAAQLAVTIAAAVVVLLLLLLAGGLDVPQQAVVPALAVLAIPLAVARHRAEPGGAPPTPFAGHARRAAPWVVLAATAAAALELTRAWFGAAGGAAPPATGPLLHTGVLVGVVGLSWLVLCRPRTPRLTTTVHVTAWVLANVVIAGTTAVAVAGVRA